MLVGQKARGKRQKAKGRRQKAEGKGQKATRDLATKRVLVHAPVGRLHGLRTEVPRDEIDRRRKYARGRSQRLVERVGQIAGLTLRHDLDVVAEHFVQLDAAGMIGRDDWRA